MKKYLCLFLAILMLVIPLASCAGGGTSPDDTSADSSAPENSDEEIIEKKLELIKDGKSDLTIVYAAGSAKLVKLGESVLNNLYGKFKIEPDCVKDTLSPANEDKVEILIGKTNREESEKASHMLGRDNDYVCQLEGNKIVIMGANDKSTAEAVNYFITKYITNNEDGKNLVFFAYNNYHFTGGYKVNLFYCGGNLLKDYKIVYPKGSLKGEYYVALDLRQHLYYKAGLDIPVIDDSVAATGKEILIGNTNRGKTPSVAEKKFSISVNDGNLCVSANDLLGYVDAAACLLNNIFNEKNTGDYLTSDFNYTADAQSIPERNGEYRIMFNNCWGLPDIGFANRDEYASSFYLAYSPDVIALNEYWDQYRNQKVLAETLVANGYVEVNISAYHDRTNTNVLPIFYNPKRVKLLDWKYEHFKWYGNASFTTLVQADDSKGVTIAVFEGLDASGNGTGEKFIVCNTHLTSNYLDVKNNWEGHGYASRMHDIEVVREQLAPFLSKHPTASVLMGCDMNSGPQSDELKKLYSYGYTHCLELADVKNDIVSHHGYPKYDETLEYFTEATVPTESSDYSIDHILRYGNTLDPKLYYTLTTKYTALFSDHSPLLLDFDVVG